MHSSSAIILPFSFAAVIIFSLCLTHPYIGVGMGCPCNFRTLAVAKPELVTPLVGLTEAAKIGFWQVNPDIL